MAAKRQSSDPLSDFHRQQNISYLDLELPPATLQLAAKHYAVSALLYGALLLFFTINPWFRELLRIQFYGLKAIILYCYGYAAYLLIAPLVFFIVRPRSLWASKNLIMAGYLSRLARWCVRSAIREKQPEAWRPTYAEKHALMFLLIKIVYGPLMINSALLSYNAFPELLDQIRLDGSPLNVCDKGYMMVFSGIFVLDSVLFTIGYHTESGLLRNKLRYAETNPLHVLVCIACYSPFNMPTGALFGPSNHNPYILFRGDVLHPMTWILRGAGLLFLFLLVSASLSLFTKASNLTNRGIVDWGPYRYIRHPGYLGKNMFWLMTLIPAFFPNTADPQFSWPTYLAFCAATVWGFVGWGTIYFLRAVTEERFLMRDPDYVAYCRKVRYRFIPGVY